jgi:hypothetical protein
LFFFYLHVLVRRENLVPLARLVPQVLKAQLVHWVSLVQ